MATKRKTLILSGFVTKEELEQRVKDQEQFILALADRIYVCYETLSRLAECEIKKRTITNEENL